MVTNAPVNHVGMAVVLDDMPPLMWHAELGRGLLDVWTGQHQRGVQLHDLREAVVQWTRPLRAGGLAAPARRALRSPGRWRTTVLRTIARLDGTPFPSTAKLAGRWVRAAGYDGARAPS